VKIPNWVAPCEGPIGEAMFMIHRYLKEKGLREKTEMNVFTPGDVFFEDIGDDVR
jgi:sulfide:quinone oxidoreductase